MRTFCINFVGVKTNVSQDLIVHEGGLELFEARHDQIAAVERKFGQKR